MKIELWSDFGCPFCYIGKTRFDNALQKFKYKDKVEVIYKAYMLNPYAPKFMEKTPAEAFAQGHNMTVEQAKERFNMFINAAKTVGLNYDYENIQMTNTFDAHRLAKWANTLNKEPEITTRFMKAYFEEGKNLADFDTLIDLVKEVDLDENEAKKILQSNQYADLVNDQITEARQVGVRGVPFFVINRKYGISGAQQEEYFAQALEQIYNEQLVEEAKEHAGVCTDDSCEI